MIRFQLQSNNLKIQSKLQHFYKYLRIGNIGLSVLVVVISIYLVIAPFIPELLYHLDPPSKKPSRISEYTKQGDDDEQSSFIPQENTLMIPKIGVDGIIRLGDPEYALNNGFWRRSGTSSPDKGGNTVITGHRFLYTSGPDTFYHLDKLEIGDQITVFWEEKRYDYAVDQKLVVEPTQIEYEQNTDEAILTLYTCTPLFTASKRLIIIAKPMLIS